MFPVIRVKVSSSFFVTSKNFSKRAEAASISIRERRRGSWLVIPVGQRPVLQILYCRQPIAIKAADPIATASAPKAKAFADATLVIAAEKTGIREIISIDPDFNIYRLPGREMIQNIFNT